jgi:hypothetical protein
MGVRDRKRPHDVGLDFIRDVVWEYAHIDPAIPGALPWNFRI